MTIQDLKDKDLIIYECISGSRAYGTDLPHSDTDIKGVFILPKEQFYGLNYIPQISDNQNDIVYYELGRFIELLSKNNPNILEMLATPKDKVLIKHSIMNLLKAEDILSKRCKDSFGGYAFTQVKKAKGLNKKIVNPLEKKRKSILHFCHILEGNKAIKLQDFLKKKQLYQSQIGLVNIPHFTGTFAMYADLENKFNYKGISQKETANEVSVSSIPKSEKPIGYLYFNKDGYAKYCKEYKAYWDWVAKRNDERYSNNVKHGKNYDSKNIMHTFRLLDMAFEILEYGQIIVERPNRNELLKIRAGEYEYEYLIEKAEEKMKLIEAAFETSKLPEKADEAKLENILIEMRDHFYQ